tara:strand:- start:1831 stop:3327 length:1497 start_codon:yes stop_codon:yes gene_type:complete
MKKITSALISVFDKSGIDQIVNKLDSCQVKLYSTGGTYDYIKKLNINVTKVEDITTYPSILKGRVKTLHPKIFGGILKTDSESDKNDADKYNIPDIDLVIVDLYPFSETVKKTNDVDQIIEKIDIGGISLIRAAAKNFKSVLCISSKLQYQDLMTLLDKDCSSNIENRKDFAIKAFNNTMSYDSDIFKYFNQPNIDKKQLRYGENPHQEGFFIGNLKKIFNQLNGKDISYNNILDIDSAINLMKDLNFERNVFAILKHNNPCGVAIRSKLVDSYKDSLSSDNISAFGGVLITNSKIDFETANEINKLFFEILIAPSFEEDALDILKSKKNRIILELIKYPVNTNNYRSCLDGKLIQSIDDIIDVSKNFDIVTKESPGKAIINDLIFASIIAKHTKSNCIILAKDYKLIGSGMGQVSRIDALNQAIEKSKNFGFKSELNSCVMASDAFFPFKDCVELANSNKIKNIIQPGGSIRDNESIEFCDKHKMTMVFTGTRHFRH